MTSKGQRHLLCPGGSSSGDGCAEEGDAPSGACDAAWLCALDSGTEEGLAPAGVLAPLPPTEPMVLREALAGTPTELRGRAAAAAASARSTAVCCCVSEMASCSIFGCKWDGTMRCVQA